VRRLVEERQDFEVLTGGERDDGVEPAPVV